MAQVMFKNKLQEYTQKHACTHPIYHTINEGGSDHAPKYISQVSVGGSYYRTNSPYPSKKQAEQAAAKLAYDYLSQSDEARDCVPLLLQSKLCKSILHEFAVKRNLASPNYEIRHADCPDLAFVSSVNFGGRRYRGEVARTKQLAEQLAAQATIYSLLETDATGTLARIILSKKASIERAVISPCRDGRAGNSGQKRGHQTYYQRKNKMRKVRY